MRKLLLFLLPAAALLAGCFSIETDYAVNEDGSGTQTVRVTIPPEVLSALGGEMPSLEEAESDPSMQALQDALGDRGSIEFFSDEERGFGFEMVINVPPSDDFAAALQAIADDLPEDSELPIGQFTASDDAEPPVIRREGDGWTFSYDLQALTDEDLASLSGGDAQTGQMAAMFLDQTTMTIRLRLPGEVTDHNADEVLGDGTLVWNQQGSDAGRTLTAASELGGGSSSMRMVLLIVGAVVAVAVVGGIAYLAVRRSGGATPAGTPPSA